MAFLSFMRRRDDAPPPLQQLEKRVRIEWRDKSLQQVSHPATLKPHHGGGFTVVVAQPPPSDAVVQVREDSSSYPAKVLSLTTVPEGVELLLDYLWEGRRREGRVPTSGPALLETEGLNRIPVEVLNISANGMQLFAQEPAPVGSAAWVCGEDSERLGLVRYCLAGPAGYLIGVHLYGEHHKEGAHARI